MKICFFGHLFSAGSTRVTISFSLSSLVAKISPTLATKPMPKAKNQLTSSILVSQVQSMTLPMKAIRWIQ